MMMKTLTVSALFAVLATPAFAQDSGTNNPDTRQTDQSEEDWRKSRKKRDTGDIFDDIVTNPNDTGSGGIWGGEVKAIDRLNPDSRRHLNRQRAKALAEAQPGEPVNAAYEPSEAAKTDEYIARQEQDAWDEMMAEANSGLGGIASAGAGQSGDGTEPADGVQGGQGPSGQGGGGQGPAGQGGGGSADGNPDGSGSPLRGGSAASASDILAQIRGGGAGSAQQAPQSGSAAGEQQGEAQGAGAEAQASGQEGEQDAADAGDASQSDAEADAEADAQTAAEAQAEADSAAKAAAHAETISPLERLKRDPVDRADTGGRTSAADYLKRKGN